MMRRIASLALIGVVGTIQAQSTFAVPGRVQPVVKPGEVQPGRLAVMEDSVPSSIAEAEMQGARYARLLPSDTATASPFRTGGLHGTADRRCVESNGPFAEVRSGEFDVRGFSGQAKVWNSGYAKFLWFPFHVTLEGTPTLTVRARRLDAPDDAVVFTSRVAAHIAGSLTEFGYPTNFMLPSQGRWLIVASAGGNWGCFVYDLK